MGQKLGDPGHAVADDVVQEPSRKSADPMVRVTEQRSRIGGVPEVVGVVALHVHGSPAQEAPPDQAAHAPRHVAELIVVPDRQLEPLVVGEGHQLLGVLFGEGERLLDVDVTPTLETRPGDTGMALGRRGHVDHVGSRLVQQLVQVREIPRDREPFVELSRHQRLAITDADDLASGDPLDLLGVGVRDLATPDDGDLKHSVLARGSSRNTGGAPPPWTPVASSRGAPSISRWNIASSSTRRASASD